MQIAYRSEKGFDIESHLAYGQKHMQVCHHHGHHHHHGHSMPADCYGLN